MAVRKEYRSVIKLILAEYAQHRPSGGEIEMETVFDDVQGHYQLVAFGWQGKKRVHGCLIHIDLKNEKVWLQHDSTDAEIARQLVERKEAFLPIRLFLDFSRKDTVDTAGSR